MSKDKQELEEQLDEALEAEELDEIEDEELEEGEEAEEVEEEEEYDPLDDFESFEDFANKPEDKEDDVTKRYNFTLETVPPFDLPDMPTLVGDDLSGLSDLDLKHAPSITAIPYVEEFVPPRWVIIIEIGKELTHPKEPDHYFDSIEIWRLDSEDVAMRIEKIPRKWTDRHRVMLVRDYAEDVRLLIRVHCNKHGSWETRLDLKTLKPIAEKDITLHERMIPNMFN